MAGRAFLIGEPNRYPSMPERQSLPESHGQRPWFQEVMNNPISKHKSNLLSYLYLFI